MRDRRRLFVLLAVTALAVSAVGSGGFSTTTADRAVSVDIVRDENAYMRLSFPDSLGTIDENQQKTFLTVQNQFAEDNVDIQVDPSIDNTALEASWENLDSTLPSGQSSDVKVSPVCNNASAEGTISATISFDVTADGIDVFAETTERRTVAVTVDCTAPEGDTDPSSSATENTTSGNASTSATSPNATAHATTEGSTGRTTQTITE